MNHNSIMRRVLKLILILKTIFHKSLKNFTLHLFSLEVEITIVLQTPRGWSVISLLILSFLLILVCHQERKEPAFIGYQASESSPNCDALIGIIQ